MPEKVPCPECGVMYEKLSSHQGKGPCRRDAEARRQRRNQEEQSSADIPSTFADVTYLDVLREKNAETNKETHGVPDFHDPNQEMSSTAVHQRTRPSQRAAAARCSFTGKITASDPLEKRAADFNDDTGAKKRKTRASSMVADDSRRFQEDTSATRSSRLPDDIIHNILSLLGTESKLRLRRVCKKWTDYLDEPHFYQTLEIDVNAVQTLRWQEDTISDSLMEQGLFRHVENLVLCNRHESVKINLDEPTADQMHQSRLRSFSDDVVAAYDYFNAFKDPGCPIQELCLQDMVIKISDLSKTAYGKLLENKTPRCRIRLTRVELEFDYHSFYQDGRMRLFCDELTTCTPSEPKVGCSFFRKKYFMPQSLHDFILNRMQPLTHTEAESLKSIYGDLVKGRPDCVIRPEVLLLKELGYHTFPRHLRGSYAESLPEALRLAEFDFEELDKFEQFQLVHFSKPRNFFQLMPNPKDRESHRKYSVRTALLGPTDHAYSEMALPEITFRLVLLTVI